jgi:hypothetical protein
MFDADMCYLAVSRLYLTDYALTSSEPEALLGRSHFEVFPTIRTIGARSIDGCSPARRCQPMTTRSSGKTAAATG